MARLGNTENKFVVVFTTPEYHPSGKMQLMSGETNCYHGIHWFSPKPPPPFSQARVRDPAGMRPSELPLAA
jgi:hypothetical protein